MALDHGTERRGRHTEEPPDLVLGLLVATFAEVDRGLTARAVVQIVGRPVLVLELVPNRHVVVERHRIVDAQLLHRAGDIGMVLLEVELRGVDADHDETVLAVAVIPGPDTRDRPHAVHARVGPEVVEHDLASKVGLGQWLGVDPAFGDERGSRAAVTLGRRAADAGWFGRGGERHRTDGSRRSAPPPGSGTRDGPPVEYRPADGLCVGQGVGHRIAGTYREDPI